MYVSLIGEGEHGGAAGVNQRQQVTTVYLA